MKWRSFSLRTALIGLLVLSCVFAWLAYRESQTRKQAAALKELAKHCRILNVTYDYELDSKDVKKQTANRLTRIFANVIEVSVVELKANGLKQIRSFPKLQKLHINRDLTRPVPIATDGINVVYSDEPVSKTGLNIKDLGGLNELTEIRIMNSTIKDGSFATLKNLRVLDLSQVEFVDFSNLTVGKSLEHLSIALCDSVDSFEFLAKAKQLRFLAVFQCNNLSNAKGLSELKSLEELYLEMVGELDLSRLSKIDSLKTLVLTDQRNVVELGAISKLTSLEDLSLDKFESLSSMVGLPPNLRELSFRNCTSIQSTEGMSNLTSLEVLSFDNCTNLENVNSLSQLANLKSLTVRGCPRVDPQDVSSLSTALPNLTINYR